MRSFIKIRNKVNNFILINGDKIRYNFLQKFLPYNYNQFTKCNLIKNNNYSSNKKLSNLNLKANVVINSISSKFYIVVF